MNKYTALSHSALTIITVLSGIQDWRKREVADWLTWPLFASGAISAITSAMRLDMLPLFISIFFLITWYFNWMGGADVRVIVGLWGLWPLAGFLALATTGLWGLVLVMRKHGKERIPALVGTAFAVAFLFILEQFS